MAYPGMWRIRTPDGQLSDMVNRTRAKDAAITIALALPTSPPLPPGPAPGIPCLQALRWAALRQDFLMRCPACVAEGKTSRLDMTISPTAMRKVERFAIIEGADQRIEVEGALAVQMACTHSAAMNVIARLGGGDGGARLFGSRERRGIVGREKVLLSAAVVDVVAAGTGGDRDLVVARVRPAAYFAARHGRLACRFVHAVYGLLIEHAVYGC